MREILTLSLPAKTKELVKKRARQRGFTSVSNYFKHLFEEDDNLIPEDELVAAIKQAEKEYKKGEVIHAKSLMELYDH